jgi:hypothetical protein
MRTTLLIILLSNQGYWFGDQDQTISLTPGGSDHLILRWRLTMSGAVIADGQSHVNPRNKTKIHFRLPPVRIRCELRWSYRLKSTDSGNEIKRGEIPVHLFAPIDFSQAMNLGAHRLVILDPGKRIGAFLRRQNPNANMLEITDASQLETAKADILIVAPDALGDSPFAQYPVLQQAKSGAGTVILEQTHCKTLAGYTVTTRPSRDLSWDIRHPLFSGLCQKELDQWVENETLFSLQFPLDDSVESLAFWPSQIGDTAVMAIAHLGAGRVVFCQLPKSDLPADPRLQTILRNSLIYLQAGPAVPANRYCATRSVEVQPVPRVYTPTGVWP